MLNPKPCTTGVCHHARVPENAVPFRFALPALMHETPHRSGVCTVHILDMDKMLGTTANAYAIPPYAPHQKATPVHAFLLQASRIR